MVPPSSELLPSAAPSSVHHFVATPRARQLFNRFVRTAAKIRISQECVEVRLGRRAHNPLLIAAGFGEDRPTIPWLGNKQLRLVIGLDEPE